MTDSATQVAALAALYSPDGWIGAEHAVSDGTRCHIRVADQFGSTDLTRSEYFLHDDGHWYVVEPPRQVQARVTHFRPVAAR